MRCRLIPSNFPNVDHTSEIKTDPRSDVMSAGMPNLLIHEDKRALVQDLVDASSIGIASGHLVDLSITVKR